MSRIPGRGVAPGSLLAAVPPAAAWNWPARRPCCGLQRQRRPYTAGQHRGIDLGAATGEPVHAPAAGRVTFAGTVPHDGRTVAIRTPTAYTVTLLHLGAFEVARGAVVAEGEQVAACGHAAATQNTQVPYVHLGISALPTTTTATSTRSSCCPRGRRLPSRTCAGSAARDPEPVPVAAPAALRSRPLRPHPAGGPCPRMPTAPASAEPVGVEAVPRNQPAAVPAERAGGERPGSGALAGGRPDADVAARPAAPWPRSPRTARAPAARPPWLPPVPAVRGSARAAVRAQPRHVTVQAGFASAADRAAVRIARRVWARSWPGPMPRRVGRLASRPCAAAWPRSVVLALAALAAGLGLAGARRRRRPVQAVRMPCPLSTRSATARPCSRRRLARAPCCGPSTQPRAGPRPVPRRRRHVLA